VSVLDDARPHTEDRCNPRRIEVGIGWRSGFCRACINGSMNPTVQQGRYRLIRCCERKCVLESSGKSD
jgi:hypothetical protein